MTKNLLFLFFKTTKQKLHSQEPETAQKKKLAEIGTQLRQYREQQSICLDKVAVVTMIRRNLLQAIEDGQLDQLPEPVYTQGLIKRYAEAIGLDGTQFAEFFPIEPAPRSRTKLSWQDGPQLRPMHLYLFYTFLIICSVNVLSQLMGGSVTAKNGAGAEELALGQQEQARLAAEASRSSQNQKPDSYEVVEAVRTGQRLDKSDNKPVMVSVTFKAESWMQVEVDGKTEFEGTLPSGTVRTWGAQKQLVVVAGNAGGVMVAVNNGQAEPLGAPGVAKEVVFKANELKPSAPPNNEG
ncbi:RodZ domain-containing protein [Microcoleus vaginatus]|uniref:RodZ domain-containing protein n=1 Tax=Microcoleus vaginatus TaxID=119532 RepID=UPI001682B462|nr:helix-turn-helix domain-containing protein [Microcoleus sp. FACHB-84]MBD2008726.1 helix-turn-helix domain-containing protein [Microcoleus sp. FACHB-45]